MRIMIGSSVALVKYGASDIIIQKSEPSASIGADSLRIAIVDGQVVEDSSIVVDVVAFTYDPSASMVTPTVNGVSTSQTTLQWPSIGGNSVSVFRATVPLSIGTNEITAISGKALDTIFVYRKSSLSTVAVSNATDAKQAIRDAFDGTSSHDIIEINYNETDFGFNVLDNIGSGLSSSRSGFLTIRPGTGSIGFDTDGTVGTNDRFIPKLPSGCDLHIYDAQIGSASSNTAVGYYDLTNHLGRLWFDNCTISGKYNVTEYPESSQYDPQWSTQWPKSVTGDNPVSFTDCEWYGVPYKQCGVQLELLRDCVFRQIRGDVNNLGKLVVNVYCEDLSGITYPGGADITHQDLFQIWGQSTGWQPNGSIFYGCKVGQNLLAEFDGQPILFSRTYSPSYSGIVVDSVFVDEPADTPRQTQFSGVCRNSRISNISHPMKPVSFRMYATGTDTAFDADATVFFDNIDSQYVSKVLSTGSVAIKIVDVSDPNDIAPELNSDTDLQGSTGETPTFSSWKINE
jgi:hypothetical protein